MDDHDAWNLWVLAPLCVWHALPGASARDLVLAQGAYALADSVWICARPECVTRPRTLLTHHALWSVAILTSLNYPVYLRTMRRSFVVELHSLVHIGARHVPALRAWRTPALVAFRILVFPLSFALTWAEATRDDAGRAILPAVGALYALAVLFNAALLTAAVRTTARRRGDARVD